MRAGRVEHDLIVLPELLDTPARLLIATPACIATQDLRDRSFAVDCGKDTLRGRVYGKGEVRKRPPIPIESVPGIPSLLSCGRFPRRASLTFIIILSPPWANSFQQVAFDQFGITGAISIWVFHSCLKAAG